MATTISKLNYMLTVDASQLDKGLQISRKEVRQMQRDMKALQTPMERYETQLAKAKPLLKLGAEGQELYNRKIRAAADALHREQKAAWQASRAYKVLQRAKQAVIGLGIGLGVGAVAVLKRQFDEVDKLAKASARLNIELEELTALQYAAATTSGLSNDQTLKGLEKMVRRVSEAAAGTGEAQAALKELNLEAKTLTMLRPDEMFRRIADRMQMVADKGSKLRLATKIFDDEQAGIFTLLEKGAESIDRMTNRAKSLGMTVNSVDAQRIEAANDAMTELNVALTAFTQEFAITLAPSLTDFVKEMTKGMEMARETWEYIKKVQERGSQVGRNIGAVNQSFAVPNRFASAFVGASPGAKLDVLTSLVRTVTRGGNIPAQLSNIMLEREVERIRLRNQREQEQKEAKARLERSPNWFFKNESSITKVFEQAGEQFGAGLKASGAFIQSESEKRDFALMLANSIGMLVPKLDRSQEQSAMFNWLFGGESNATQASRGFNVMDSIQSGSAEAFRLEFRRVAKEDAQLKESKRTAEASEETNNLLGELLSQFDRFGESDIS